MSTATFSTMNGGNTGSNGNGLSIAAVPALPVITSSSSEMLETSANSVASCGNSGSRAAAGKRSLLTHAKDGKALSDKKLRRLEKNRLSARECRRRKREATENLEREIYVLEGENLRLRLQLQIGEEAEESMRQEQEKVTENIDALLKSGASEAVIFATIEEFKEKFADYGRDRRSAIEFHLRNIERLLMPTQTTSLAMRALQGGSIAHDTPISTDSDPAAADLAAISTATATTATSTQPVAAQSRPTQSNDTATLTADGAPDPNLEPKALFKYLVTHLGVTPEQAAALKDSRFVAQEMDGILVKALAVLEELRSRLAKCGEDLDTEFNNIRSILTPTQAAKFLVWVANNSACMHMLNELWSRVYPEHMEQVEGSDGDSP